MIGVISNNSKQVVNELFQLFKTPWEYFRPETHYRVIFTTESLEELPDADVLVLSTTENTPWDRSANIQIGRCPKNCSLDYAGREILLNSAAVNFSGDFSPKATVKTDAHAVIFEKISGRTRIVRIGFNMLSEIENLLTVGQSAAYSKSPALEIHIDILRQSLIGAGVPFVEIPPVPAGSAFFVSLTHDVDFYRIRDHLFDHTFFGFVYRAGVGELIKLLRGYGSFKKMLLNWWALIKLPFVFMGLIPDLWPSFEKYTKLESNRGATYYLIPFKKWPGIGLSGSHAPSRRSTKYDAADIETIIRSLETSGFEIGLHGIDAWNNPIDGRREADRVSGFTGRPISGVRMHWLYFNAQSYQALEAAGFNYDSTVGYNDAVGFKSGTAQVYGPLNTEHILEIPMILQDSALFYPGRMGLTESQAWQSVIDIVADMKNMAAHSP